MGEWAVFASLSGRDHESGFFLGHVRAVPIDGRDDPSRRMKQSSAVTPWGYLSLKTWKWTAQHERPTHGA